jgi:polar amino acid transport system permease protein
MIRSLGPNEILFIISAARWTILLSLVGMLGGGLVGFLVALGRVSENRYLRLLAVGYVRVFQGTPLLLQLFLVYFGLSILGVQIDAWFAASIGLILNSSAFLGDIWRGCIQAVPAGQTEAGKALGLGAVHRMSRIVLPQAVKIALAPTVGFIVQLIKNTSLTSIIGFTELTRSAQIINNATFKPFIVFSIVAAVYFALCFPLSAYSRHLEKKLAR